MYLSLISIHGRNMYTDVDRVWTHNMRGFEYHEDFRSESCSSQDPVPMAFTVAAGERVRDVYTAAAERNAVVVAGSDQDVGIVGWFSGGGRPSVYEFCH
jgi:hypothetical protein